MRYSVYAVLGVNSWSCHGEKERDDLTLCSAMMVELWTRKREMGDEDENDIVFATVPVLDPAGFIGLGGNGLTPSKIDDFSSAPLHYGYKY